MGQKVKIRVSLAPDINFLSRLMMAIEADTAYDMQWRREVMKALQRIIMLLANPLKTQHLPEDGASNGEDAKEA